MLCIFFYFELFILINRSGISNGTMLSMSDKYASVNKRTQEISELMKLHILSTVRGKMPMKFIRQLTHGLPQ